MFGMKARYIRELENSLDFLMKENQRLRKERDGLWKECCALRINFAILNKAYKENNEISN